jgi:hypothetical protein
VTAKERARATHPGDSLSADFILNFKSKKLNGWWHSTEQSQQQQQQTKIVIRRQQEHGKARPKQKKTCRLVRKSEKEGTYKDGLV